MVQINGRLRSLHSERGKSYLQRHLGSLKTPEVELEADLLRFIQIIEHHELTCVPMSPRHIYQLASLKKIWMRHVFLLFLRRAEKELLDGKKDVSEVKKKLAERYLGQLVGLKESIEAGYFEMTRKRPPLHISLSQTVFSLSDEVLYITLEQESQRYASKESSSSSESDRKSVV